MSTGEEFFVDIVGFGEEVNIMPLVLEALDKCPYHHDFLPLELAHLIKKHAFGKYIPVDIQDRVEGRNIGALIGFVTSRIGSAYRIKQLQEPAPFKAWEKYIELDPWNDVCPAASALTGQFLKPESLLPLPLEGCWGYSCHCQYKAVRLKDLERSGRVDADGCPIPMPQQAVRCYVEDHPEVSRKASPLYRSRTPRELGTREPDK